MLAMLCLTYLYAFLKLHDVSWGTKGLTRADVRESLRHDLLRMRNRMLAAWILLNLALLAAALATMGFMKELNLLTATMCGLEGVFAISGLAYIAAHGRRR
jgi:hypothetical protein